MRSGRKAAGSRGDVGAPREEPGSVSGLEPGASPPDAPRDKPVVPGGVTAVVALSAGVLALIGLTGGVLVRAVRSSPGTIVVAIAVLIVLAVVAERSKGAVRVVAGVAILGVVLLTLGLGATSIDERDKPSVALKATSTPASATAPGTWTITVRATASGLRAREDMLVQLQGLRTGIPTDAESYLATDPGCRSTVLRTPMQESRTPYPTSSGDLLLWTQAGPGADGSTVVESSVQVPLGAYKGACAVAIYSQSRGYGVERLFDHVQAALNLPTGNEQKVSLGYIALQGP
ncbi:MAG: hypothetical protein ABIQ61_10005 [Ornithinibacter sp.]